MGDKLKILMTADTLGGVWTYAVDLCQVLSMYPVEIHLAAMGNPLNIHQRKRIDQLPNVSIYEGRFKLEWMENPWHDVEEAYKWLREIHDVVQPDLIHFNNYGQAAYHWKTPTITVAHSCVLSWWKSVKQEDAPTQWNNYRKVVERALMYSDLVVAPTKAFLNTIQQLYGGFIHKKVIYNGTSLQPSTSEVKEPFILSAGRVWDEAKNIAGITKLSNHLHWPIYIAGENGHPVTKKIMHTSDVYYLGNLSKEELWQWMNRASIYALPAYYEPFGLSILEAASAGCALVLGDIDTLREIWEDAALFVDPGNPEKITEALDRLINDKALTEKYGQLAQNRARKFSLASMGENYYQTYLQLLPQKRTSKLKSLIEN